ncbi:MAG: acyl-CoA dehydrogenase [Acidobacteria bacterium]|nr:MAG: acyl-CoA dehydrogenase [Acidobacteriota bacterium]
MDFDDTPEEAAFRAEAREWLEANVPEATGSGESLVFADVDDKEAVVRGKAWLKTLFEGGWAGLSWPKQYGGRDCSLMERVIWSQECAKAGAPSSINTVGEGMAGPTIISHGTDEHKERFLPPLLAGDEIWCQLFSEPDAGSDVSAVKTKAVRDGDEWIVTGQKIWTSGAHYSDWGVLICRTNWDVPKHAGITYFIVDMHLPGVDIRPLRQMTGGASFNEVFFDEVRIPDSLRMGPIDGGWQIAVTTLMNERMSIGTGSAAGGFGADEMLSHLSEPDATGRRRSDDPVVRQLAMRLYSESKILQWTGFRAISKLAKGAIPGPEGSAGKLTLSRITKLAGDLMTASMGMRLVCDVFPEDEAASAMFLFMPALPIAGGTDEVQKNIIGERVLQLAREPRVDKDVPFKDIPASA